MSSELREIIGAFGTIVRETRKSSALSPLLLVILAVALLFATAMVTIRDDEAFFGQEAEALTRWAGGVTLTWGTTNPRSGRLP